MIRKSSDYTSSSTTPMTSLITRTAATKPIIGVGTAAGSSKYPNILIPDLRKDIDRCAFGSGCFIVPRM